MFFDSKCSTLASLDVMCLANSSRLFSLKSLSILLQALHVELPQLLVPPGTEQPDPLVNHTVVPLLEVFVITMGIGRFASMPHLQIYIVHEEKIQFHHELSLLVLHHPHDLVMTLGAVFVQILFFSSTEFTISTLMCAPYLRESNGLYGTTHLLSTLYSPLFLICNVCVNPPSSGDLRQYFGYELSPAIVVCLHAFV